MLVCVERPHQEEDVVATVHGDDIQYNRCATDGSRVPHQDDIPKVGDQETGTRGNPDLEKTGRMLNRVIEWDRDGITIGGRLEAC